MKLQTAIEIVECHQEWRLGKRKDMIPKPKKLVWISLADGKNI